MNSSVSVFYMMLNELATFRNSKKTSSFGETPFRTASFLSNELPTICMYNRNQTCHPLTLFIGIDDLDRCGL